MTTRNLKHDLEERGDVELPPMTDLGEREIAAGTHSRYEQIETQHGRRAIAIYRDEDTGELRSLPLYWTVLQSLYKRWRPQAGERFAVRRLPDHAKGYRVFTMVVDRETSQEPEFFSDDQSDPTKPSPRSGSDDKVPF